MIGYPMRLALTTIILTMLAQLVWAKERMQSGDFQLMPNRVCEKAMAEGVYLGHAAYYENSSWTETSTRIFFEGQIYLVDIFDQSTIFSGWRCRVFVPKD